jgi:hypothetical protein
LVARAAAKVFDALPFAKSADWSNGSANRHFGLLNRIRLRLLWSPKLDPNEEQAAIVSNDDRLKKTVPEPILGCGGNVSVGVGC